MASGQALSQNQRGEWVPAIPLPFYRYFRRECQCGRKFWSAEAYRGHFALVHILACDGKGAGF